MIARRLVIAAIAASAAIALAACSPSGPSTSVAKRSKEYFPESQYGKASPRVVQVGQRAPKGGGRQLVGAPYRVAGKTYIPRDNPGYSAKGLASWYGEAFHGRRTANGEVYDVEGLTAAHPTLPLPSYARVTNLRNGRSIIVRVNDRGPFAHDRVIDLSKKAADILGYRQAGTTRVQVDYVGPARMDGLDHDMLMASYREGGVPRSEPMQNSILIAAAPAPRYRPPAVTYEPPSLPAYQPALAAPMPQPTPAWEDYGDDPLGPLIMRTGFANGYAAEPERTGAQKAIESIFVRPDLRAALERAADRRARELGLDRPAAARVVVVQLGSFGNAGNAARVVRAFARYGEAEGVPANINGRELTVVRVALTSSVNPVDVISAAAAAGLSGAFVVSP